MRNMSKLACFAVMWLSGEAVATAAAEHAGQARDWRDQVIYFAMIDRFDNGDPGNDDQGGGEYDPADPRRFSGGDLAGLVRRLDYIRGLGATALWITPPVANQWWSTRMQYGGYHGYWAQDFTRVDPHFGDLAAYRKLADGLHARGMKLVQDIVVNHTADHFSCTAPGRCVRHDATPVRPAPLAHNDPRNPRDRARGIYHWTPDIADFGERRQELDYQLAGLDDLDTGNPEVRRALRRIYGDWIGQVGVDAFRVDTAFYVPERYFRDFLYSDDPQAPGILRLRPHEGGAGFHVFGEGFGIDRAFDDTQARRIEAYMHDADGPLLPGMINFPLYGTLGEVFARGRPAAELGWRIEDMMRVHADPWLMPTFVDNHDVERFLAGGSEPALRQALLAIMTLPGIPVIYYGTEQGFRGQRDAMFVTGYGAGGRDHFDRDAPLYRYLQRAIALRRTQPVFSRGRPRVLRAEAAAPGALIYRMDGEDGSMLVAFNTADHPVLLDGLQTGFPAGTRLDASFSIEGDAPSQTVGEGGRMDLMLPPRAGWVWRVGAQRGGVAPSPGVVEIEAMPGAVAAGDFPVRGTAPGAAPVQVVVDGDLGRAQPARVDADGRWSLRLRTDALMDPQVEHRLVAWQPATGAISAPRTFHVRRDWQSLAMQDDPAGDDAGPSGRYRYPGDPGWSRERPGDIRRVRVLGSGGSLRLELDMHSMVSAWNAPNGFDHVAFTVYLGLPGRPGATLMPLQNASLPDGLHWNYRLRIGGWSNALTRADGATADDEGTPVSPGAQLAVDRTARRIAITLPANALGDPGDLGGATVYVTTWDHDGGYRELTPEGGGAVFGGGDGNREPLWMDAALLKVP